MSKTTESVKRCKLYADMIRQELDNIVGCVDGWHTANEIPSDDDCYIVITKTGAKYFSRPIGGKWLPDVNYWLKIPPTPE